MGVLAVAALAVSAACGSSVAGGSRGNGGSDEPTVAAGVHLSGTQNYLPARAADVYLPSGRTAAPVVVLVPGGAWQTADRSGLSGLSEYLATAGLVVVNTTHRAAADGGTFPGPVQDVTCSVNFAVQRAREAGLAVTSVVLLGHSSGAHLAALAALAPERFQGKCPYPRASIDALVGMAGSYDVERLDFLAESFFGTAREDAPQAWTEGNPLTWARRAGGRQGLRVLLLHGSDDTDLPTDFTTDFATALRAGGHPVRVEIVPGATHQSIYLPPVSGARVVSWLRRGSAGTAQGRFSRR